MKNSLVGAGNSINTNISVDKVGVGLPVRAAGVWFHGMSSRTREREKQVVSTFGTRELTSKLSSR